MLDRRFTRSPRFDAKAHQSGSFGVWAYEDDGERLYQARLLFSGYAARVVSERKWHPSQEITGVTARGDVIEMRLRVAGLEELTRWVLSWGGNVKVLSPGELRRRVLQQALTIVDAVAI